MAMAEPLIHIGYHKTGSTWLQERIFADRGLGFVRPANPLPIDEAFVAIDPFSFDPARARAVLDDVLREAASSNAVPVLSHERLSGDIETGGVDSQPIADRLAATFPDAKVLIVIREQREMLLSIHKTELTFGTYRIARRWRDRTITERRSAGPTLTYFEYDRLIAYYQRLFGPDDVLVLASEMLQRDALGFASEVTKFVGLPAPTSVSTDRANAALPALVLELNRWFNKLVRALGLGDTRFEGPIEERLAKRGQLKVLRALAKITPRALSRPVEARWRAEVEATIGDRYRRSNQRTQELTGLDLGALGYQLP
jgi:hypothetical protein